MFFSLQTGGMTDDAVEELQGVVIFLMSFFFPLQVKNVFFSLQTGGMTDDAVEELQGLTRMRTLNISQNEFVGNPAGKIFFY